MATPTFTKEILISRLQEIRELGWIPSARPGNSGGVGNTLEDLLGIEENNLPIPNAAEWELKTQRLQTTSLTTLIHMEPSPRALRFVPSIFLPQFGWAHQQAGTKYSETERSFRQTIFAKNRTDRGFGLQLDHEQEKLLVTFDPNSVDPRHIHWLNAVPRDLETLPYWGFQDLYHKAGSKLNNCFYVGANTQKINGIEYFHYSKIKMLRHFSREKLIQAIAEGAVCVDFDARTGHNHGTKFRFRQNLLSTLYDEVVEF